MNNITKISYDQLHKNCIYSAIAHAVFTLKEPFFSYSQSWDGYNYSFHHGTARGTISFYAYKQIAVGAARDEQSVRRKLYPRYDAVIFFNEAPNNIKKMALQDPLEYLYDEEKGVVKPIASIGFWLDNGWLCSADDIDTFRSNGGDYVFIVSQSFNDLVHYWKEEYSFSDNEIAVVNLLYKNWELNQKTENKDVKHIINKNCPGFNECLESLNEIGICL